MSTADGGDSASAEMSKIDDLKKAKNKSKDYFHKAQTQYFAYFR